MSLSNIGDLLALCKDRPNLAKCIDWNLTKTPPTHDGVYIKRNGQWIKLED